MLVIHRSSFAFLSSLLSVWIWSSCLSSWFCVSGRSRVRCPLISYLFLFFSTSFNDVSCLQRRQSDLKAGRRGSRSTKFRFFRANFREISIFSGNFTKFRFFKANFEKFRFFQANFWRISIFFRQFKKNRFSRQNLLIFSYFWENYSISLQKPPLSNILPVHDKI